MTECDVIVVGAGLTGLTAARELQEKYNRKVLVLEARDRVGGRTLTESKKFGGQESHFDLGAHFIGDEPFQNRIWELVEELGLEVFPQYAGPGSPSWSPGSDLPYWAGQGANLQELEDQIVAYIGGTIPPSEPGQTYLSYLQQLIKTMPLASPQRIRDAKNYDTLSVWDWVTSINLPGVGPAPQSFQNMTRMLCRVGFSAEPEDISMLWLMFYIASSGGLARFQALRWPTQGAQGYRLKEGAQAIAEGLAAKLNANDPGCVITGSPIVRVDTSGGPIVYNADGTNHTAKLILIAMAPKLYEDETLIKFAPKLTEARLAAARSMSNSSMFMTYVTFDEPFWRNNTTKYPDGSVNGLPVTDISRYGLSGDALLVNGPVVWVMDNTSAEGQPALFAFIVGEEANKLADATKAERGNKVLEVMVRLFGNDVHEHDPTYYEKDWITDEWSQGCPASHFRPGTFFEHGDAILLSGNGGRPDNHVFFASTETASVSNGYMAGAVWSGEVISQQINESLDDRGEAPHRPLARTEQMTWCINTILSAIQQQNPLLEGQAITKDVVFHGPGGTTLPYGPYPGFEGMIAFYERLGVYFSISSINIENVAVSQERNLALAEWNANGTSNTNGLGFRDVKGLMLFEFNDPGTHQPQVRNEWLFMDTEMIDAMMQAPPTDTLSASAGARSSVASAGVAATPGGTYAETNSGTKTAAAYLTEFVSNTYVHAMAHSDNPDQHDAWYDQLQIYGPGGVIPHGPTFGKDSYLDLAKRIGALDLEVVKKNAFFDFSSWTGYLMLWFNDKGPMVFTARVANGPDRKLEQLRCYTDGQALS